ncbi:MAG: 16S rRNA (guanine(966)-N(2))-methyltransferase RsmD [Myxococcota bacterium]
MKGLRVTGGRLAGRRFRVPPVDVRPTSDRVRESLFAQLGDLAGQYVLDLYSGSGALAIEAASRGAHSVVCVERAPRTLSCLRVNLASLELESMVRVVSGDVPRVLRRLARAKERFDLVLIDPPYGTEEAQRALRALMGTTILAPQAVVVLERERRHPSPRVEGLVETGERRYGDTVIARYTTESSQGRAIVRGVD